MMLRTQFLLGEDDVPTQWYNILADLPFPVPNERRTSADTGTSTGQRVVAQLPLSMYRTSISRLPRIEIPEPVRDEYRRWRPTPLYRAWHLERLLDTPARIYYKYEGSSPAGSHKLNTAVAQAYFYKRAGIDHVTTGTGAGQWGTALAMACQSFALRLELTGDFPDVVIGCMGAGSNFAGLAFPFYREKIRRQLSTRLVAVEPEACPKLTRGVYTWDYNDFSGVTPMAKIYTLGHRFVSAGIHAGGLRYHAAAPIVSAMYHYGAIEAVAYPQRAVFEAGLQFVRSEKTVPAPESTHAIRCAVDEAIRAREEGKSTVILFNLSGHGLLDLSAYEQYLSGQMQDCSATDEQICRSLASIPIVERE